jgi:hypothetical protein
MKAKNLLLPVLLVVGEGLDELDVELVTMFTCLAAGVFNPTKHDDVVDKVLEHVELDDLPCLSLSCRTQA